MSRFLKPLAQCLAHNKSLIDGDYSSTLTLLQSQNYPSYYFSIEKNNGLTINIFQGINYWNVTHYAKSSGFTWWPKLGVYLGVNEVLGVYKDKSMICLSNNSELNGYRFPCLEMWPGQMRGGSHRYIHTEWDISQGDLGISTSSGEKITGRGVGSVYNRCVSQCPRCDEQLDPLTVPNTWCIKELTEIQFLQRKASAL